jgi:hypothetical protein
VQQRTINREAGDKANGLRLQKLRAVALMVRAINQSDSAYIYAAVEHVEDVHLSTTSSGSTNHYLEQDKNYDPNSTFTIQSPEIAKTLISFLDDWFNWERSKKNLFFGFYASNMIGKEKATKQSIALGVTFPDKAILKILVEKTIDSNVLALDSIKKIIISKYKESYLLRKEQGYVKEIELLSDEQWRQFLSLIDWNFEKQVAADYEEEVIQLIRQNKNYSSSDAQNARVILSSLIDLFDKKQSVLDLTERFVHASDVQLIFRGGVSRQAIQKHLTDPVWRIWSDLPEPTDKRSLKEKLLAVCNNYDQVKVSRFARRVGASKLLENVRKKGFLSLKYRIYDRCEEELEKIDKKKIGEYTEQDVDQILEDLRAVSRECINNLSKDFDYGISSPEIVDGIILELMDSCYLTPR